MDRKQAEELIQKPVEAWTDLWGEYIGILENIIKPAGSPWRGEVRIKSIMRYPAQEARHGAFRERYPFKFDELKEFGGVNIKPFNGQIIDYTISRTNALEYQIQIFESIVSGRKGYFFKKVLAVLEKHRG